MTKLEFDRFMSLLDEIQKISSQEMFPNVIDGINRDRYAIIRLYFDQNFEKPSVKKKS